MAADWYRWKYCLKCRHQGLFGSYDGADQIEAYTPAPTDDARRTDALHMAISQELAYGRYSDPHPDGL